MKATTPPTAAVLRSPHPVAPDAAGPVPTPGEVAAPVHTAAYLQSASFLKSLQQLSLLRMAWLHRRHPEWKLADITRDMKKWFDKDIPADLVAQVIRIIQAEWRKKNFLHIDATQMDRLFDRKSIG